MKLVKYIKLFIALILLSTMFFHSLSEMDGDALKYDAHYYLVSAYNIWKHNVFSNDEKGDRLDKWNEHEPMLPFIISLSMRVNTDLSKNMSFNEIACGKPLMSIKKINLLGVALVSLLLFALLSEFNVSFLLIVPALILNYIFFLSSYVNTILSEIPASIFILFSSWMYLRYFRLEKIKYALLGVGSLACFALIKGLGIYLAFMAIPCISVLLYLKNKKDIKSIFKRMVLQYLVFTAILSPWMLRNYYYFDDFNVRASGGTILLTRAFYNEMSHEEWKAGFLAFGTKTVSHWLPPFNKMRNDPEVIEKTKRLNRGSPEDWNRRVAEEPFDQLPYFLQAHYYRIKLDEKEQKALAIKMICANPIGHLKNVILFGWRGLFSFRDNIFYGHPYLQNYYPIVDYLFRPFTMVLNMLAFSALFLTPIIMLFIKKYEYLVIALMPIGVFTFYAIFSYFLPRYSVPIVPLTLLFLVIPINFIFNYTVELVKKYTQR